MAIPSNPDWQETFQSTYRQLASYRKQHDRLRQALGEAGCSSSPAPSPGAADTPPAQGPPADAVPPPVEAIPPQPPPAEAPPPPTTPPGAPRPPGEEAPDGKERSRQPVGPQPPPGWKERCRQSILNGEPQARIQRLQALCALTSSYMEQVEGSLEAASCFLLAVAERTRDPSAGVTPQMVHEVVSSEEFQRLCASALADLLRPRSEMAHSPRTAILCNGPGKAAGYTAKRKGVPVLKTQEGFFWWWIIIILIVVFFLFFLFPLDQSSQ